MSTLFGEFNPMLPPPRHLSAIGKIVTTWAQIENTIEVTIIGLYELDLGRGLVFTANLSFQGRMSLLAILAGEKDGAIADKTLAKELRDMLTRIEAASGDRNEIAHAVWTKSDKPGCVRRLRVRLRGRKLKPTAVDYSADSLIGIADSLHDLSISFSDLIRRLGVLDKLEAAERHSASK